jgi:hypothetical protein
VTQEFLPHVRPLTVRTIEFHSRRIIRRFFPGLLRDPGVFPVLEFWELLRERFGLDPGVEELSDGVDGVAYPDGRILVNELTYRGATLGKGRDRETMVHEGYHGLQHRLQIRNALVHQGGLVLYRRQSVPRARNPEWQADVFAGAALMPRRMFQQVFPRSACQSFAKTREAVKRAAGVFQVTRQAVLHRMEIVYG